MLTKQVETSVTETSFVKLRKNDIIVITESLTPTPKDYKETSFGKFRVLSNVDGLLICTPSYNAGMPDHFIEVVPVFVDGGNITMGYNNETFGITITVSKGNVDVDVTMIGGSLGRVKVSTKTVTKSVGVEVNDTVYNFVSGEMYTVVNVNDIEMVLRTEENRFTIAPIEHAEDFFTLLEAE